MPIDENMKEIETKMDTYKNNAMSNIEESIKLAISHISRSVISVSSPSQIDPQDIFDKIAEKVDKSSYEAKLTELSRISQIQKLSTVVDILHKQIKTLGVIQFEIIKNDIEMMNNSIQANQHKQAYLLRQSVNLDTWISSLNPLDFENIDSTFHLKVKDEVLRKISPRNFNLTKSMDKISPLRSVSDLSIKQQMLSRDYKSFDKESPHESSYIKILKGKIENDADINELNKIISIEPKQLDKKESWYSILKHLTPNASKGHNKVMNNTAGFIIESNLKDSSPKNRPEIDMNMTSNFLHSHNKSSEKIKKHLLKSVKQSVNTKISNIKTISKIRIKNLGKRRDRSLLNSKRIKNESPIEQIQNFDGVSSRISNKYGFKSSIQRITKDTPQ